MKYTIPILCAISTFVVISDNQKIVAAKTVSRREVKQLSSKYDHFDIDRILNSERLLRTFVDCFLDKKPCTSEGKELKGKLVINLKNLRYN